MLNEAALFLLDAILQSFAGVMLLRFHLQWMRVPLRNPIGELVMALTDFLVLRARRYIPSIHGLDTATLLLALLIEMIYLACVLWIQGYVGHVFSVAGLVTLSLVKLLKTSLYLLMGAVFAQVILSWVNPYAASALEVVTRRFLQPLRNVVPMLGVVDLTPMLFLIVCQLIMMLPLAMLESLAYRML